MSPLLPPLPVFGITLRFAAVARGNGFAGAAWRGLLGQALAKRVCPFPSPACPGCPQAAACAYPRLFKPLDPDALAPAWLHGAARLGETHWQVGLRWIGEAHHPGVAEWIDGLHASPGEFGGQPVRLESVLDAGGRHPVARSPADPCDLLADAPAPQDTCHVRFVTPLVSKHHGDPLWGALATRWQRLLKLGGLPPAPRLEAPWRAETLASRPVRIPLARRVLTGTQPTLRLSSIHPNAWPLLWAGQTLHAGGQTAMGCGQYRIESS